MLLIIIGLLAILNGLEENLDQTTSEKKARLILNKVEYNVVSLCYYSKVYDANLTEFVSLPKNINGHQYELFGNGTHIKLVVSDKILTRKLNVSGIYTSGRIMKIECNGTVAKISN